MKENILYLRKSMTIETIYNFMIFNKRRAWMESFIVLDCSSFANNLEKVIKQFQSIGWGIRNSYGNIEYLPKGDTEYCWICEDIPEDAFYDIIYQKETSNEQVGVNLFYANSAVGISLISSCVNKVILSLEINRKKTDYNYTDIIWYIEKIILRLRNAGEIHFSYKIEEIDD